MSYLGLYYTMSLLIHLIGLKVSDCEAKKILGGDFGLARVPSREQLLNFC